MNKPALFRKYAPVMLLTLAAVSVIVAIAWSIIPRRQTVDAQANVLGVTLPIDATGYTRVEGPPDLTFPRDFGQHAGYQTEWWYYTGNLQDETGRRFGYQLTFFRRALVPPTEVVQRGSHWAANQVYMAHFTLTDVSTQQFHYAERFERAAAGLAGAQGAPAYSVWLHDWKVAQVGDKTYHLVAEQEDVRLDLMLVDSKGIVLQGERGYSRKGPEKGNASIYYSQTHLESTGTIQLGEQHFDVRGLSWMDREISTSVLSEGQIGWDWFALHLDDGSDMMVFALRRADGTLDNYSAGIYVAPDGSARTLAREDFEIIPEGTWRSPHSGATYPARFHIRAPSLGLDLTIKPQVADQELNVSIIYWEGAVEVTGSLNDAPVSGFGYAELTGYAESLEERF